MISSLQAGNRSLPSTVYGAPCLLASLMASLRVLACCASVAAQASDPVAAAMGQAASRTDEANALVRQVCQSLPAIKGCESGPQGQSQAGTSARHIAARENRARIISQAQETVKQARTGAQHWAAQQRTTTANDADRSLFPGFTEHYEAVASGPA